MTQPNFLSVPSAYKSGKIYSVVPFDGSADMDFTRASLAYRTDRDFNLQEMASGVPRLDYKLVQDGIRSCPMWIYEPKRTNLYLNSEPTSGGTNVSYISNTMGIGLTNSAYFGDNSKARLRYRATVTNGVTYTISFYIKSDDGLKPTFGNGSSDIGLVVLYNARITSGYNIIPTDKDGVFFVSVTATAPSGLYNNNGIVKLTGNNAIGFEVSAIQIEEGSYPTSYIKTEGSAVTRVADSSSLTGLKAKGLIGASEGSIGGEYYTEQVQADKPPTLLILGGGSHGVYISRQNSNARGNIIVDLSGVKLTYVPTQDYNKWLFAWDANGWFLSVNGLVVGSGADVFTFPTDNLTLNGAGGAFHQGTLFMSQTKYTEAEATEYTSYNTYEEMAMLLGYTID